MLFSYSCFFYSAVDPRDLHSFPTRRSSDLAYRLAGSPKEAEAFFIKARDADSTLAFTYNGWGDVFCDLAQSEYDRGDRKSTRLNSSHTVISYAVFCLKKKKIEYHPSRCSRC